MNTSNLSDVKAMITKYEILNDDKECNFNNGYAFLSLVDNLDLNDVGPEPKTYQEAMNSKENNEWKGAIKEEIDSLIKNDTWVLVNRTDVPKGFKIIDSRWVNKRKLESNGKIRYRSRLVTRGFLDNNLYDLTETYAPVARISDVRFMLIVANKFDLEISQLDVKTAFLNGELEKKVYTEIPEGYDCSDEERKEKVCLLKRALYGLKVSPKRWFLRLTEFLLKMGFNVYPFQSCLFIWKKGNRLVLILFYVDDILIIGDCKDKILETKRRLAKEFEIRDMGSPRKFLGIEIERNRGERTMMIHQTTFINAMLKRFKMTDCKPVDTPMVTPDAERKTDRKTSDDNNKEKIEYREAVGSLMYLASSTCPDITYAINYLSRRQNNYTLDDWIKVKRVFRYLQGTRDLCIKYQGKSDKLECYVDASLGMNDDEGKSTSGYLIRLFDDLVMWRTKRQTHVALSSAESEFIAMSLASRELTSVREMCSRILRINVIPFMYEDNRAAIEMAKTDDSQSLKHIVKLCYHYIRLEVKHKNVIIEWISSDLQQADFFTKPLPKRKFNKFRDDLLIKFQQA